MAIEDDERPTSVDDQYAIGLSTQVSTVLSLYGRRISAYIGIMMVPVIYSFIFSTIMFLLFGEEMLQYLGSEPVSFIYGTYLLLGQSIPPEVFGPYVGVGGVLMLIGFVLSILALGAAIGIALRTYTGQSASIGSGFGSALERFPTLLVVTLIIGSIYAIIMIPIQESVGLILDAIEVMDFDAMTQASSTVLILTIVYILVVALFYPNGAVVMEGDESASGSISRTIGLTRNSYLHTLAGIILFHVILVVITLAIDFGLGFFIGDLWLLVIPFASALIITPLTYIYQAVLYKDLASRSTQTKQEYW
ncbi:MAG: hypothetical protein ACFFER_12385 [Candidatus Thorarchaeota archaeon]